MHWGGGVLCRKAEEGEKWFRVGAESVVIRDGVRVEVL